MTRLIDADKLIRCLQKDPLFKFVEQFGVTGVIDAQPTVEAVRHGKWIDEGYYANNTNVKAWHCSECNWHMLGYKEDLFRYCPMCGSRIDEDEID